MQRISWRSLLLWTFPVLAFAWLAIAGRAASGRPDIPPAGSLLGGGHTASEFQPGGNYDLHFTTVSLTEDGKTVKFYGDWNGRCQGYNGAVTASFFEQV